MTMLDALTLKNQVYSHPEVKRELLRSSLNNPEDVLDYLSVMSDSFKFKICENRDEFDSKVDSALEMDVSDLELAAGFPNALLRKNILYANYTFTVYSEKFTWTDLSYVLRLAKNFIPTTSELYKKKRDEIKLIIELFEREWKFQI